MTSITLVRRIAARQSIVFEALTTADGVGSWWGTDDLPVILAEVDARVGGAFRIRFPTLDGQEHEAYGEYLELAPPNRLVMSWRWVHGGVPGELGRTSRIEIELRPVDGGVQLTVTHADLENEASGIIHESGWTDSLARLSRLVGNR